MSLSGVIGRDEIAALEVVADPHAAFHHNLRIENMNIKWILTRVKKGNAIASVVHSSSVASSGSASPASPQPATHTAPSTTPHVAPVPVILSSIMTKREQGSPLDHSPPPRDRSVDRSTSASRRTGAGSAAVPNLVLTIRDLPQQSPVINRKEILINSPRSALVILSKGYAIADLCRVDPAELHLRGSLEGTPKETIEMRITAENKRRIGRYKKCLNEYIKLSGSVSFDEVVRAIREHKYGDEDQRQANKEHLASVPLYAHGGKQDLTLLDEDCINVLLMARERAVIGIRRELELTERNITSLANKEQAILAKEIPLEKIRQMQEEEERKHKECSIELQKRHGVFKGRLKRVLQEQEGAIQQRRILMEQRAADHEAQQEAKRNEELAKKAELRAEKAQKRLQVQADLQQQEKDRVTNLIQKSELKEKLKERDNQRRKEATAIQAAECKKITDERLFMIKQIGEIQGEDRRHRVESILEKSSERLAMFGELKQLRIQAKRQITAERHAHGEDARRNVEELRLRRLSELEDAFEDQQKHIAELENERKERLQMKAEMAKQTRITQIDEKRRCFSAVEFKYVSYMGNSTAKAKWMVQEGNKIALLASHARQEREALNRAKEMVLRKIEQEEMERRKMESAKLLSPEGSHQTRKHQVGPGRVSANTSSSSVQNADTTNSASISSPMDRNCAGTEAISPTPLIVSTDVSHANNDPDDV